MTLENTNRSTSQSADSSALEFDVVIVGAGLVGSAMACALAADKEGQALRIAVIEAGTDAASFSGTEFDPRVVALTHTSRALLDSVGAWPLIVRDRLCPYTDMEVWDAEGTGNIHFDCRDAQQSSLGHIVENSVISRALMARLASFPQITLLRPARVSVLHRDADSAKAQVILDDGRKVTAALLLAADGANSKIRELANMPTREWNYGHDAIVTTVKTSRSHNFTAWQRFLPSGPLAFLPLSVPVDHSLATDEGADTEVNNEAGSHYCSIVWSVHSELAEGLMALSDEAFAARLSEAFEYRLGEITDVAVRFTFPLRQRHAIDYGQDNIALLGDAAHTIHPLAGQGANLGFLDVCAMRDEILRAARRQLPLSDASIIRRYQRVRKSHNLAMMGVMEGFKRLFGADDLPVRWLRNEGMRQLNSVPLLKNAVMKQAMGL